MRYLIVVMLLAFTVGCGTTGGLPGNEGRDDRLKESLGVD